MDANYLHATTHGMITMPKALFIALMQRYITGNVEESGKPGSLEFKFTARVAFELPSGYDETRYIDCKATVSRTDGSLRVTFGSHSRFVRRYNLSDYIHEEVTEAMRRSAQFMGKDAVDVVTRLYRLYNITRVYITQTGESEAVVSLLADDEFTFQWKADGWQHGMEQVYFLCREDILFSEDTVATVNGIEVGRICGFGSDGFRVLMKG